jgi:hypothetical protein
MIRKCTQKERKEELNIFDNKLQIADCCLAPIITLSVQRQTKTKKNVNASRRLIWFLSLMNHR